MEIDLSKLLTNYSHTAQKKVEKFAKEDKNWYFIEVILTLFTVTFFVIFAIRPAVVTISGLVGEINRKEELSKRMRQKINSVIIAQEQYSTVQENWQVIESFLPSDFNIAQGVAQVAGQAQDRNLKLSAIGLDDLDFAHHEIISSEESKEMFDSDNLSGLSFNIKSQEELDVLRKYITTINQSRRWTKISKYQLSKSEQDTENESSSGINISVEGYWLFWQDK